MPRGKQSVFFAECNIRGGWAVYGVLGIRQYYDYTKAEAITEYTESAEKEHWQFVNKKSKI